MRNKEPHFINFLKDLLPAFFLCLLPIFVFIIDHIFSLQLYKYGIQARNLTGLRGIIFSPFLHGDWKHLMSNSVPLFALLWLIRSHFRDIQTIVILFIWIASGFWTWIIGGQGYTIGSSSVVYGLAAFAVTAGFLSKNRQAQGIGLFTLFFYGSLIWGIFPLQMNEGISWQGHLSGLIAGILVAFVLQPGMPPKPKYSWETEPEIEIPYEEQYWREDYVEKSEMETDLHKENKEQTIKIVYEFIPTKKDEEDKS